MRQVNKIDKQNIGNAGEYYIAARLSAENFIVTITLGRAERYDILCVSPNNKSIKLSVKTSYSKTNGFPLSVKDEKEGSDDIYYAFVILNEFKKEPEFWIIPSKRVNSILKYGSDVYYNNKTKKDGSKHIDSGLRKLYIEVNKTSKDLLPPSWIDELASYKYNIKQLI